MSKTPQKGPWMHRFLVHVFTVLFGLLAYWLLGFAIDDISQWPGPDYQSLEQRMLDPALSTEAARLEKEAAAVKRNIEAQQARQ